MSNQPSRLLGLDLLRGLAAFDVVVIHTPAAVSNAVKPALLQWLPPANAVFAIMAGYFMMATIEKGGTAKEWLLGRAGRLLVPYVVWTVIYVALNVVFDALRGTASTFISANWCAWMNVVFFGGGGIQLWFLVVLFYAQIVLYLVCRCAARVVRSATIWALAGTAGVAFAAYPFVAQHGTTENAGAMLLFMLGYVFLGAFCHSCQKSFSKLFASFPASMAVVVLCLAATVFQPVGHEYVKCAWDIVRAFLWFAMGAWLPVQASRNIARSVSEHSMGIYLLHIVFTTAIPFILLRVGVDARGNGACLVVAASAFLGSWCVSSLLSKHRLGRTVIQGLSVKPARHES